MNNYFLGSMDELVNKILSTDNKEIYYGVNTDCYNLFRQNEEYHNVLNGDAIKYTDGAGILIGAKILGMQLPVERIATTDLFPALLKKIDGSKKTKAKSIFLLGGKPGIAEIVAKNMSDVYNVNFSGTMNGYDFSDEAMIEAVNRSNAEILFVGFGAPKQELWVQANREKLNSKKIITCGGLFDYYSDNVKRAPVWMQKFALEWLFRLLQEPRRLSKRYLVGNPKFIYSMLLKRLNHEKMWS